MSKIKEYRSFVEKHGNPSEDFETLLTASVLGLITETGEFADFLKQHKFHGKSIDYHNAYSQTRSEMILELGDIIFYWMFACLALNVDPEFVMQANMSKLEKRHPKGFGR